MLNQYLQQTQLLLNDTAQQEYNTTDLTAYINTARGQIAASTQCVRFLGSLSVVATTQSYPLSGIGGAQTGSTGAFNIRMVARQITNAGAVLLEYRPWEWAFTYWLANPAPVAGPPTGWTQQQPGPLGSIYFNAPPDTAYTLKIDCVGGVAALTSDSSPEAISYPWTDGVPYFAAYLAYLNSQRAADSQSMFARWEMFAAWATKQTTPTVLPDYSPGGRGAAGAASRILNTGIGSLQGPGRGGSAAG